METQQERVNRWKREHRPRMRELEASYRIKRWMSKYNAQDGLCAYCGAEMGDKYHVDHILPRSKGGTDLDDNIALSCPYCNLSKGNKVQET